MATPRGGYYVNGKRVPSVTTIGGRLQDQSGLIYAAVKLAKAGIDYKTEWGWSAKVGTAAHFCAEEVLAGRALPNRAAIAEHLQVKSIPDARYDNIQMATRSFNRWLHQIGYTKPQLEVNLISEEHGFGGTFDCLYETDKGYVLCDWKTSKLTTVDHMHQLAAYGILVEEHMGPVCGYNLVRIDKEYPDFHQHHWGDLTAQKARFIKMLDVYRGLKEDEVRLK